jgi:hypothetical protein
MNKHMKFPLRVNRTSAYTSSIPLFALALSITYYTEMRDPECEDSSPERFRVKLLGPNLQSVS